jgi:hypothetical protein
VRGVARRGARAGGGGVAAHAEGVDGFEGGDGTEDYAEDDFYAVG